MKMYKINSWIKYKHQNFNDNIQELDDETQGLNDKT